jgi:glycosyltransferase involved in cell wall biosynthesis
MRIVQVVGDFAPERCGVAHYTQRLADHLTAAGVEVAIGSRGASGVSPVPLLPLRFSHWTLSTLLRLLMIARRWNAEWVHLQYAPGSYDHRRVVALLPLLAKLIPGAPRIAATVHEFGGWPVRLPRALEPVANGFFPLMESAGWFDREALALFGMSDVAIVTNSHHLRTVQRCSTRLARRTVVIPIGPNVGPEVALDMTRETARARLGVPSDRFVAIFFGFVHPVKGIETLLQAMRRIHSVLPLATLWIVGGVHSLALRGDDADAYEGRIRQMIDDLDLGKAVEVTGYLPDTEVACRLRAADLAVLPFNHGVTLKSGSLVTCLSYRLPVLATTGGDLSGLRHGDGIWLVPPRDPVALAEAFGHLASNRLLRERLAAGGEAMSSEFSWARIAQRHLDLYRGSKPAR